MKIQRKKIDDEKKTQTRPMKKKRKRNCLFWFKHNNEDLLTKYKKRITAMLFSQDKIDLLIRKDYLCLSMCQTTTRKPCSDIFSKFTLYIYKTCANR